MSRVFMLLDFLQKSFTRGRFTRPMGQNAPMGGVNAPQSEKAICFKHLQHTDKKMYSLNAM